MEDPQRRPPAIMVDGEWYILASAFTSSITKHVLKDNDAFVVTDDFGDLPAALQSELGYYHKSTRFLNGLEMRLNGERLVLLQGGPSDDEGELLFRLTNPDIYRHEHLLLPRATLFVERRLTLHEDVLHMEVSVENFHQEAAEFDLQFRLEADFYDIFEVRGQRRTVRGVLEPPQRCDQGLRFRYTGLDGQQRTLTADFQPRPSGSTDQGVLYRTLLPPGGALRLTARFQCSTTAPAQAPSAPYRAHRDASVSKLKRWRDEGVGIFPSHPGLTRALRRASADLGLLASETEAGLLPYAGIPWYCTPFGRDALITALQLLPWRPQVARTALYYLAARQGDRDDPFTDQEEGKVLHEYREGELANLGEVPFLPYYGSLDATPLFLITLHRYVTTTGDRKTLEDLWPNALRALQWMRTRGDLDGDGLLEYHARSPLGLRNQAWKDSHDAVHHRDGAMAEPPIAPVEVQAYAYQARLGVAALASTLRERDLARQLRQEAEALRQRLHRAFWVPDMGYYALALDRHKRPCAVVSSNPGHALWMEALDARAARQVVQRLFQPDMFSGYGIRTLSSRERRYNPLSYHNGSVWPHDCAIIAQGLRAYRAIGPLLRLASALTDAIEAFPGQRAPELFAGFPRRDGTGPVPYPVACAPQAWASGALFMLLTALLGLRVDGAQHTLLLQEPVLPEGVEELEVRRLPVGQGFVSFSVLRGTLTGAVEILEKSPSVEVVIKK